MQIKYTSEKFSKYVILKLFKSRESDYQELILKGSTLDSESKCRELYLRRGAFAFFILAFLLIFPTIASIFLVSYFVGASYLSFFIIYIPLFFFLILGGYFRYLEKKTILGHAALFNNFHLVLSLVITLFVASTVASLPFLETI